MSEELFDGVLAAGPVRTLVGDRAWLQAMLDFEAALALAHADEGLLDAGHAELIARECSAEHFDPAWLGARARGVGNPAAPLVRALTERVDAAAAPYVHLGATSQDVLDTAAMLVADQVLGVLDGELGACAGALAELAGAHRDTVQVGRTLGQHALPSTFGYTAATWLSGVDSARRALSRVRTRLAVQFGGAVGTLASLDDRGPAVAAALARRLGLAEPVHPWHTERGRVAELAGALGQVCGTAGKIAGDVVLLAQTDVAEVHEAVPEGGGGSSTMPHKRNPVAAVAATAAARQGPGLVSTLLTTMVQDHQRASGSWHAEWRPLTELLRSTGAAVSWLRTCVVRLRVDPDRMRANLDRTGGVLMAERVATELAPFVGRTAAQDAVAGCAERATYDASGDAGDFGEVLAADPVVGAWMDAARIAELLAPDDYLGNARTFTDRALAAYRGAERTP